MLDVGFSVQYVGLRVWVLVFVAQGLGFRGALLGRASGQEAHSRRASSRASVRAK